ncbi:hypothetical protein O9993_21670 [Vibrio lentus]|nr:hypothetical protein [Vibrio lentus]
MIEMQGEEDVVMVIDPKAYIADQVTDLDDGDESIRKHHGSCSSQYNLNSAARRHVSLSDCQDFNGLVEPGLSSY